MHDFSRQVVVIGGGVAGLNMASVLSRLGYKVTIVEKDNHLGGNCLHYSCVPSKAFIKAAQMVSAANNMKQFGIHCSVDVDFAKIMSYVKGIVGTIEKHESPVRFKSYGIDVMYGHAHFVGEHMLSVDNKLIPAEKFIIATGSRPYIPSIKGLEQVKYCTTENILELEQQPKHLLIIGGGTAGIEYAQAFACLGTKVTIVESKAEFMGHLDRDQMNVLKDQMQRQGVEFISSVSSEEINYTDDGAIQLKVAITDQTGTIDNKHAKTIIGDALLIATGRVPQLDALGLDLLGIEYNENGINVDQYLRTSRKHIYAIGDVVNSPFKLTHISEYHASIVVSNLAFKFPKKLNYHAVPRVMYTNPEWAQVGLTEKMANEQRINHQIVYYSLASLDRAIISNQISGQVKLIVRRNKLLGASILSPHAGELIHELTLAMQNNVSLSKIAQTIHAYPTWSQMHKKAIGQYFAPKFYSGPTKFLIKLLGLIKK